MSPPARLGVFLLALSLVSLLLCTDAGVQETIEDLAAQYTDAFIQHDGDRLMGIFEDDFIFMPAGSQTIIGKTLAEQFIFPVMNGVKTASMTSQEIVPLDDEASYVYQRLEIVATHLDGSTYYGKDLRIWKKHGNCYKIHLLIYNSNK